MATNDALNNSLATQTGTGKYVGDTAPTITNAALVTPDIGVATGETLVISHIAPENDTLAVEIVCNAAGFSGAKALDIDFITGAVAAGQEDAAIIVNIDDTLSTGGEVYGMEVLTTPGLATTTAIRAGALVNPLEQLAGTFADADSILNIAVDVTAALASGGAGNITTFVADNDTLTIGDAAKFEELSFNLDTPASGGGIAATFEFSTGSGTWSTFGPTDGTNNMKNTGVIAWDNADVLTWAVGTSGDYLIRITRTKNSLSTTPIIDEIQKAAVVEYGWDKVAYLTIKQALLDADPTLALEAATKQYVDGLSSSGTSTISEVNQGTHALTLGMAIRIDAASTYVAAGNTTAAAAEVIGMVSEVVDANNFKVTTGGYISGIGALGLAADTVYFLSTGTGLLTATEPTTAGYISRPVLVTDTTSSGFYLPYRGVEVGATVDTPPTNNAKNLIIGGDFSLNPWQRGTTFAAAAHSSVTADRFKSLEVGTAVVTVQKTTDAPTVAEAGLFSQHCLEVDVTTADVTLGAGDLDMVQTIMEGYDFAQIAQTQFTISFWVKAKRTGVYCVSFVNSGADRSYVAEYTIAVADTWEKQSITVAASPSAGTWDYTNGKGIKINFVMACGTTFHTTKDAWQTGNFFATSSQVNAVGATTDYLRIQFVQVEIGTTATPFEIRSRGEELALCKRYYQKTFAQGTAPVQNVGSFVNALQYTADTAGVSNSSIQWELNPVMREIPPTVTLYNPNAANAKFRNVSFAADSGTGIAASVGHSRIYLQNPQAAGDIVSSRLAIHATADAEF